MCPKTQIDRSGAVAIVPEVELGQVLQIVILLLQQKKREIKVQCTQQQNTGSCDATVQLLSFCYMAFNVA